MKTDSLQTTHKRRRNGCYSGHAYETSPPPIPTPYSEYCDVERLKRELYPFDMRETEVKDAVKAVIPSKLTQQGKDYLQQKKK